MRIDGASESGGRISNEDSLAIFKESTRGTTAGNLKGNNLQVAELIAGTELASVGLPKPGLTYPQSEPSLQNYEQAGVSINNAAVQFGAEVTANKLEELLDKLNVGKYEGKDVVADDIRLKNITPEQLKELKGALKGIEEKLRTLESADTEVFIEVTEKIEKFEVALKSGNENVTELTRQAKDILDTLEHKSFTFDSSKTDRMGNLLNKLGPRLPDTEVILKSTDKGVSGTLGGKNSFSADFENKNMKIDVDGKQQVYSFNEDNTMKVTIDGKEVEYDPHETRTLTDFFQIMALFHEMGVAMRRSNREGRNAAQSVVIDKIKAQADKQRTAAAQQFVAGIVSASAKMASGAIQLRGSVKAMSAAKLGNTAKADALSGMHRGLGMLAESGGEGVAAFARYQAGLSEAEVTDLRAGEEEARFVKQTAQDQMEVAKELTTKARETYSQVWNSYLQAQQKITGNI